MFTEPPESNPPVRTSIGSPRYSATWRLLPCLTWAGVSLLVLATAGCGEAIESLTLGRRAVEIGDVPESVMAAAKKTLPDVEFADAWKNVDRKGNLHSYEIRGRNANGKIREVRVSAAGEILEIE